MNYIFTSDLEAIQNWAIRSWFRKPESSAYNDALLSVILKLWPEPVDAPSASKDYTFLNLPALCYHALGGTSETIFPVNLSWILLYASFYLLDKVEDQETDHVLFSEYGAGPATNLTTGLILNAGCILSVVGRATAEAEKVRDIQTEFYRAAAEVCAGQHLDLTLKDPDLETAWAIAAAKSGNFFSLGCRLGAMLSAATPEQIDAFALYGYHLGTLIQIANDFEGLFPNEHGKSDIITGKYNLPIAYSFHVLPDQEKTVLHDLLSTCAADVHAEHRALQMIIQCGALVYLYFEAEKQKALAVQALKSLNLIHEMEEILLLILDKIINRLQQSEN